MTRIAVALADVAMSPRRFNAALRREGRCVRRLVQTPRVRGVATRFDSSLLGEALIAALGDRLAATLRWWDAAAVSDLEERTRARTPLQNAAGDEVRRATSTETLGERSATSQLPQIRDGTSIARETVREMAAPETLPGARKYAPLPESTARRTLAALLQPPSAARAPGKDSAVAAVPRRDQAVLPLSPLVAALRKWERGASLQRPVNQPAGDMSSPVRQGDRQSPQHHDANAAALVHDPAQLPSSGESRAGDVRSLTPTGLTRERERQWWTARVDAIHARVASVPRAAPNVAPNPVQQDDLAFADTLGEVLRAQAKLYGVDVI
ncbi:MAG: hypothetical protein ACT4P6_13315 [Gemmatimonadaceae bacterium]